MNDHEHPEYTLHDWLAAAQLRTANLAHQTRRDGHPNPAQLARILDAYRRALGPNHNATPHLRAAITHLRREAQQ